MLIAGRFTLVGCQGSSILHRRAWSHIHPCDRSVQGPSDGSRGPSRAITSISVDDSAICAESLTARCGPTSRKEQARRAGHPQNAGPPALSIHRVRSTHDPELADLGATLRLELERARDRLDKLAAREEHVRRDLAEIVASKDAARETLAALEAVAARAPMLGGSTEDSGGDPDETTRRLLSGAELRETLTRVALRRNAHGEPVHWSVWHGWLRNEGFDAAGKRGEATFQTQLGRSPLVRRAEREGVYVLDVSLLDAHRGRLVALHQRLADLPPPGQLALLGDARAGRRDLQQEIARTERALEESWRILTEELGELWGAEHPPDTEHVMRLWDLRRRHEAVDNSAG
jgi:hypothetical protein